VDHVTFVGGGDGVVHSLCPNSEEAVRTMTEPARRLCERNDCSEGFPTEFIARGSRYYYYYSQFV
jgi:hypothetical protein